MNDILKDLACLCRLDAPSGREDAVRDYLLNEIKAAGADSCETDNLGNIIVFKRGKKRAVKKIMLDAHMDEVGFIVTAVTPSGLLRFNTVGGISKAVVIGRRVRFKNTLGVIGCVPVHQCDDDARKKLLDFDKLYIDIGAKDRESALKIVAPGDTCTFDGEYTETETTVISKAIDDRAGCAVLLNILKGELPYDMYFTFTTREEVGLLGARTAAFRVNPDCAIAVEATTAADIPGVEKHKSVCSLGSGAAVSFMDGATVYDEKLYKKALETAAEKGIACQPKCGTTGGNNAGAIHCSGTGVKTLAVSLPCRYIHSESCVCSKKDLESVFGLVKAMAAEMAAGNC